MTGTKPLQVHGAAVVVLGNRDETPRIEGTAGLEIAMLGSFQGSLSAGGEVEAAEPVNPVKQMLEAVEPKQGEAVQPYPEEMASVQKLTVQKTMPVAPEAIRSVASETVSAEPLQSEPTKEVPQVSIPTARAPVDTIEAVEPTPIIPEDAPLPSARPEPVREASVNPDRSEPKHEPVRKKSRRKAQSRAGNGRKHEADSHKGQTTGRQDGNARASGAGKRKGGTDGNAAVSNYPGKVAARLRRAVRSVPRSARRGAKRDVHVYFVVTALGGVGSVRVTQSSGSSELDRAALASVRRAAPFPPIPSGAGRSKWPFSVPLGLAR